MSYCIGCSNESDAFYLNGVILKNYSAFEYLGLPVGDIKHINEEFKNKFREVEKKLYSLNLIYF